MLSTLISSTSVFADVDVNISPTDRYVARINLSASKNTFTLHSNAFYICGALKPSCFQEFDAPYGQVNSDGISYKIIEGKLDYTIDNHSYFSSYTQGAQCSNFPPPPYSNNSTDRECSDISNGLSIGFISNLIPGQLGSGKVSVSAVEISTNGTKPGKYFQRVYLNESLKSGNWSPIATELLNVTVRENTCNIQNQLVDMGNIIAGVEPIKKRLNLNLQCTAGSDHIKGASWKYTNVKYGDDKTNLSNVFISVKNNKNEIIKNDTPYTNVNELNDLFIEVNAKSNAQAGKFNVPLRFTLTYS